MWEMAIAAHLRKMGRLLTMIEPLSNAAVDNVSEVSMICLEAC